MPGPGTTLVQVTPTISTSAYTAADVVGNLQTITNAVGGPCTGVLKSLCIKDKDSEGVAFSILVFDSLPTGTITDNAALSLTAAQFNKAIGVISVATTDWVTVNSKKICVKEVSFVTAARPTSPGDHGNPLYAIVVTTGTPTYTNTDDLTFEWGFLQD